MKPNFSLVFNPCPSDGWISSSSLTLHIEENSCLSLFLSIATASSAETSRWCGAPDSSFFLLFSSVFFFRRVYIRGILHVSGCQADFLWYRVYRTSVSPAICREAEDLPARTRPRAGGGSYSEPRRWIQSCCYTSAFPDSVRYDRRTSFSSSSIWRGRRHSSSSPYG